MTHPRLLSLVAASALLLSAIGCDNNAPPPNYPGYCPPGQYCPGGAPGYPAYPGQPPQPGAPPVGPNTVPTGPPPPPQLPPMPPVVNDPITNLDIMWMRDRARQVLGELVQALPPQQSALVGSIPLIVDDTPGEVNAFAACSDGGQSAMAISDGLLEIQAQMANCRATDEYFGTRRLDAYVQLIARDQQPDQPIVRPPPAFYDPGQQVDGRKVARQHDVFDEQLAFVMGHELAHHYLGHTGCVANPLGVLGDLGRVLSNTVPVFNQPNESAADVNGTNNLLSAGARRPGYHWTEGGALLTLNFFAALQANPADAVLFGFMSTHPHPLLRIPIVQNTANQWRAGGGRPAAPSPFPFPFPFPGQ